MASITALTVSWRSAPLLREMLSRLLDYAEQPDAIRVLIADNTNGADRELDSLGFEVVPVNTQGERMSMAHALGLHALMPRVDTPFFLVVDPDTAILVRGWDTLLPRALDHSKTVAIGAPYTGWKLGKYHDFPSPPFALWRTESLRALEPDWRPYGRTTARRLLDFALRQTFWVPRIVDRYALRLPYRRFRVGRSVERIVGVVSKDTGWEIAQRARNRGWRAELFETIYAGDELPPIKREVYHALATEFELFAWDGQPILTHRNPTRTEIGMNLWTSKNVTLYQNRVDSAAQTERWGALVRQLDAPN